MRLQVNLIRKFLFIAVPGVLTLLLLAGCGKGSASVEPTSDPRVIKLTKANFNAEVLTAKQPVLVDFWAVWCGPCKAIAPVVAELAGEFEGKAKVGKVDVDAETDLAKQYNIAAIPTLLIFKDGKVVSEIVGAQGKTKLKEELEKFVGVDVPAPPP